MCSKKPSVRILFGNGTLGEMLYQKYPQRKKEMQQRMKNKRFETKPVNYVSEEEELDDDEMVLQGMVTERARS